MTSLLRALRTLGLVAVAAAVVDPGCRQPPRSHLAVATVGELPTGLRQRAVRQVAAAAPWAEVFDESSAPTDVAREVTGRVVVGDAAPLLRALRARPAAVAVRAEPSSLTIRSIRVPSRVVIGMRADVAVAIGGVPSADGVVRAVLRDATSGLEQGQVTAPATGDNHGDRVLVVPWLATRVGHVRLRAEASFEPSAPSREADEGRVEAARASDATSVRPAPPADAVVDVRPAAAIVTVLEARPTWGARFARLALADVAGIRLTSEVRVSPGVTVRTGPADTSERGPINDQSDEAEVIVVGGLESLSAGDLSRLEREVSKRGRAVVLLMDAPPAPGPWQRLWPDVTGPVRQSARMVTGLVAGHPWKLREWLSPVVSTDTAPLAYLDSGSPPFVLGRARGAGRIVLVTALDAWRWRAAEGSEFAPGWRALVQRLAADVPAPVTTTAWATGTGRNRSIQVDVSVRPDVSERAGLAVVAELGGASPQAVPLVRVESGRWRGALRVAPHGAEQIVAQARVGGTVVGLASAVVDVSPLAPVASWEDVQRHQSERGALATDTGGLGEAFTRVRGNLTKDDARRWYVTRTWWFAGLALSLLGTEWILRRLYGER